MRTPPSRLRDPNVKKRLVCGGRANTSSNDPLPRIATYSDTVSVYGWPSRGGVIILEDVTHVDFEFLGLSTTDPPLTLLSHTPLTALSSKDKSVDLTKSDIVHGANDKGERQPSETVKKVEDTFCQLLLLLGAKWWDSKKRNKFVHGFASDIEPFINDVEDCKVAEPTPRERRWVKVGWEQPAAASASVSEPDSSINSGFWILDRDSRWAYMDEDNLVPENAGIIKLARTMQERCTVLKKMGATYYANLEDYESEETFLKAWEWKWEGEVRTLQKVDIGGSAIGDGEEGEEEGEGEGEGESNDEDEDDESDSRLQDAEAKKASK